MLDVWAKNAPNNADTMGTLISTIRDTGWTLPYEQDGGPAPRRKVMNQVLLEITSFLNDIGTMGVLTWHTSQSYVQGALVVGSDNNVYVAVQDNSGVDPTTDTMRASWTTLARSLVSELTSLLNVGSVPDNSITLTKWASGTAGRFIQYDSQGRPTEVALPFAGRTEAEAGTDAATIMSPLRTEQHWNDKVHTKTSAFITSDLANGKVGDLYLEIES